MYKHINENQHKGSVIIIFIVLYFLIVQLRFLMMLKLLDNLNLWLYKVYFFWFYS